MENLKNISPIKVDKTTIINLEKGKLPPQALDLEEAVLGAMMVDKNGLYEAIEILCVDAFYKDAHKYIFEAIFQLFTDSQPVDLLTVSSQLKKNLKLELSGGDYYLIQLTQKVSSSAHIEFHSRIILQKYIQRSLIRISAEVIEESYCEDNDALDSLDNAYRSLGTISDLINLGKSVDFKKEVLEYNSSEKVTHGVHSSISNLNKKLNGYQKTDFIVVAGRPGMGKTAFALNEILECGLRNIPVAFFSLEMSTKQIIGRFLSILSGIDSVKIRTNNLSQSELQYLNKCKELLASMPIYIDDTAALSTTEFKIKSSRLKREKKIEMIWVDYLQLMTVKNKKSFNRENEVSEISSTLKATAKELDIPVSALSQLSRAVETRGSSKRPQLSDLRDSGSIEQDADAVMFIYRPEYYKIEEWDDDEQAPTKNTAEIDLAKYRAGEPGVTRVGCVLKYMRFMDLNHVGLDLTEKYFRKDATSFKIEGENLPRIMPSEAFSSSTVNNDDDTDVPF